MRFKTKRYSVARSKALKWHKQGHTHIGIRGMRGKKNQGMQLVTARKKR